MNLAASFGVSTDIITPDDYDGDGKQDIAVYRPSGDASPSIFYSRRSISGLLQVFRFGRTTDYPAVNWFVH